MSAIDLTPFEKRLNKYRIKNNLPTVEEEVAEVYRKRKLAAQATEARNRNLFAVSIRFFNKIPKVKRQPLEKQSCLICLNAVNDLTKQPYCKDGLWLLSDSFFLEHRCYCFRRRKGEVA